MKKNLLSVLILALLIVNIVLTFITMFSVTSTNKKTAAIIGDIATILQLQIGTENSADSEQTQEVSIDNTAVYNIEDKMTIPLKKGADGAAHYAVVSVSLAMNIKDKGYKEYGEGLADKESLIKGEIVEAFGSYTLEEVQANTDVVREDILLRVQKLFDSEFIYKITFRDIIEQ